MEEAITIADKKLATEISREEAGKEDLQQVHLDYLEGQYGHGAGFSLNSPLTLRCACQYVPDLTREYGK